MYLLIREGSTAFIEFNRERSDKMSNPSLYVIVVFNTDIYSEFQVKMNVMGLPAVQILRSELSRIDNFIKIILSWYCYRLW